MKITTDEVLVYRERWGAIAISAALGATCFAIAVGFYWLMRDQPNVPSGFLLICCCAFGIGGAAILLRLPGQARKYHNDNGAHVFAANGTGLALTPGVGAETQQLPWSSVAEVVLAERFRFVEQSETEYSSRTVVVFLPAGTHEAMNWIDRVKPGVSKSGSGRPYLLGSYPRGQGRSVEAALRKFAPGSVPIHLQHRVIFNAKTSTDAYAEA